MKTKKKILMYSIVTMMMAFCLTFGCKPTNVKAASSYTVDVSTIKQTSWATNSIGIQWSLGYVSSYDTVKTAKYNVYLANSGDSYGIKKFVGSTTNMYYQLSGLEDGKEYRVYVEPVAEDGSVGYMNYTSVETVPATVKNFRQDRWYFFIHVLDVTWDEIDTADKITVTLYNSKGKKVGNSQELNGWCTSATFTNMKDEVYTVKIQASKTVNGQTYTTPVSSIQCFNQARITSAKVSKKKLTVRWGKVGGATGYDVYVSTKPTTGYKKVKSVGKNVTKVTIPKLKGKAFSSKKTYYVYVETKKKNGKKVNKSGRLYYWDTRSSNFGYF